MSRMMPCTYGAGSCQVTDMTSTTQYRCPNCKHAIPVTSADFIKGIAFVSCAGCGMDAFAIEEALLK
ncbi:MAG: hypothetical protein OIN85_00280 [Candidatus Methanoperedens sp.]|nr:hypothetical protein [Candidatus Methanoperedens sp.]